MNAASIKDQPALVAQPVVPFQSAAHIESAIAHVCDTMTGFEAAVAKAHLNQVISKADGFTRLSISRPRTATMLTLLGIPAITGAIGYVIGTPLLGADPFAAAVVAAGVGFFIGCATGNATDVPCARAYAMGKQVLHANVAAVVDFVRGLPPEERAHLAAFVDAKLESYKRDGSFSVDAAAAVGAVVHNSPTITPVIARTAEAARIVDALRRSNGTSITSEIEDLRALLANCEPTNRRELAYALKALIFVGDQCRIAYVPVAEVNQLYRTLGDNTRAAG